MESKKTKNEIELRREKGFILDCVDKTKAKIPEYNPLTDKHMSYKMPESIIQLALRKHIPNKTPRLTKDSFTSFLREQREKVLSRSKCRNTHQE